jgi:G3E family GTPase
MATLDRHAEAVKQAAMADRLVVTKVDRAEPRAVAALEERLHALNPGASILRKGREAPDPAPLFETGLHRGEGRVADPRGWLNAGAYRRAGEGARPVHDPRIASFAWTAEEPFEREDLESALETLASLLGGRILRMKGLVNVRGEPGPLAVHAVQHTLYPPARLPAWPDEDRRTRLVFIGRDLEESAIDPIFKSFRHPQPR